MFIAPDLDTLSVVLADDLKQDDQIVNVGQVDGTVKRLGVWVLVTVAQSRINPGTGQIHINEHQVVWFHEADSVIVVQAPE